MALSTSYSTINSLGDDSFVAGTTYQLKFTVVDQNGTAIDLTGATCTLRLAEYGSSTALLTKTGSITATNVFTVLFVPEDTDGLAGKYSYQPKIVFSDGSTVIPAQGIITLIREIE